MADSNGRHYARPGVRLTRRAVAPEAAEPSTPWYTAGAGSVTLRIIAKPGAPRRQIVRIDPRGLVIALKAAPEKGRANDELLAFVAAELGLPRRALELTGGASTRRKNLRIATANPALVITRLIALAAD
jgi:uncharacterized protein